jgi:hypothetical protein
MSRSSLLVMVQSREDVERFSWHRGYLDGEARRASPFSAWDWEHMCLETGRIWARGWQPIWQPMYLVGGRVR